VGGRWWGRKLKSIDRRLSDLQSDGSSPRQSPGPSAAATTAMGSGGDGGSAKDTLPPQKKRRPAGERKGSAEYPAAAAGRCWPAAHPAASARPKFIGFSGRVPGQGGTGTPRTAARICPLRVDGFVPCGVTCLRFRRVQTGRPLKGLRRCLRAAAAAPRPPRSGVYEPGRRCVFWHVLHSDEAREKRWSGAKETRNQGKWDGERDREEEEEAQARAASCAVFL
jgi:hypothetical protein